MTGAFDTSGYFRRKGIVSDFLETADYGHFQNSITSGSHVLDRQARVFNLLDQKATRKWLHLHVDTPAEAAAAIAAGIEVLSCEPDHNLEKIRQAAPTAFISASMPHGVVSSPSSAVRLGFDILRRGADAVYCSHSPFIIEAMAREAIPVTGHIGLVPNKAMWTSYRAIGKGADEALSVLQAARDLENAGAAFCEIEVVPVQLADYITRHTKMITMGMGCGDVCDTQYLFSCDVLGTNTGHYPRHSKRYADFQALEAELQNKRIEAFKSFAEEVSSGAFPDETRQVKMSDGAFDVFLQHAEKWN